VPGQIPRYADGMRRLASAVAVAIIASLSASVSAEAGRVCWPGFTIPTVTIPAVTIPAVTIPAVTIPAVTIPAVTIPATCIGGTCYPAQHYPAQHYPAQHYPAQHYPAQHYPAKRVPGQRVPGTCFNSASAPAPAQTSVRVSRYGVVDPMFSPQLSRRYWRTAGPTVSYPNVYASGFGGLNAAGFPKNQYVRSYFRRDGTFVHSYWRNSPTDGLPTCRIIRC
jgi:hypothetical protein